MKGPELINNMLDELDRAKEILLNFREGTEVSSESIDKLIDDIRMDLGRYYEVADSINSSIEDIEFENDEELEK